MTLHYKWPEIRHIDDVLPHIAGCKDFIVVKKDYGVTIINYAFQTSDTFPPVVDLTSAIRRECRGLIFDTVNGDLIRRSFAKFFNYGEKHDVTALDLTKPHSVVEKLDGSMITPLPMPDGTIRWASKMGITSVSMQAETFIASHPEMKYEQMARDSIAMGVTPIFEWCSRQQRIVVDYANDQLVLLAVRFNEMGDYASRSILETANRDYNVPVVQQFSSQVDDLDAFVAKIRAQEQDEGAIILWEDGTMVKIKADAYVTLHRAKSMIGRERDVVLLILTDKIDDLIPLLDDSDKKRLEVFTDRLLNDCLTFSNAIVDELTKINELGETRKEFAQRSAEMNVPVRAAVFRLWDNVRPLNESVPEYVSEHIKKYCQSAIMYRKIKPLLATADWHSPLEDEMETV